jgi:RNA polymerase sigma-70 factor (ECF subfamily)
MGRVPGSDDVDGLLAQAEWLRGLAGYLVHGGDADDVVQETWVAAMRSPPEASRPVRPWLAQVLRNVIRMDARGAARRRAREEEGGRGLGGEPVDAEAVLERLELQRMIAEMVKELDEPFRTAVLLRFFEGRLPADVARAQGIPAGTVRWRINEGLRRLRERLDHAHGGQRDRWRALLLPLSGGLGGDRDLDGSTAAVPGAKWLLPGLGTAAIGVVLVGMLSMRIRVSAPLAPRVSPARASAAVMSPQGRAGGGKAESAGGGATSGVRALVGVTLPALVAGAEQSRQLTPPEALDFCVEMRERSLVCKEVLADIRVARVPREAREASRRLVLQEIVEDGTGPVERRRAKCAADLQLPGAFWIALLTRADVSAIRDCHVEKDCKMGIACWMNTVEPVVARSRQR